MLIVLFGSFDENQNGAVQSWWSIVGNVVGSVICELISRPQF